MRLGFLCWLTGAALGGFCLLLLSIAVGGCDRTRKSQIKTPLRADATFVQTCTYTPGFLDPSFHYDYALVWANGREEPLPPQGVGSHFAIGSKFWKPNDLRFHAAEDSVWIIGSNNFVMREGGRAASGPWITWRAYPSEELFDYLDEFARLAGDKGVRRTTCTIPKQISSKLRETETESVLIYEELSSQWGNCVISASGYCGSFLPHRIDAIDFGSRIISCVSVEDILAMPKHLVFEPDPDDPNRWRLDRERSSSRNAR
jgi:hypothetical protein